MVLGSFLEVCRPWGSGDGVGKRKCPARGHWGPSHAHTIACRQAPHTHHVRGSQETGWPQPGIRGGRRTRWHSKVLQRLSSKQRPRENRHECQNVEFLATFVTKRTFLCATPALTDATSVAGPWARGVRSGFCHTPAAAHRCRPPTVTPFHGGAASA